MPIRKGVVPAMLLSVIGAAFSALCIVWTWQATHSPAWATAAALVSGLVLRVLDAHRAQRRRNYYSLPVHVKYPGSTAV